MPSGLHPEPQTVRERLRSIALERGLRQSTLLSHDTLLTRTPLIDLPMPVLLEAVTDALWTLDNVNTRRAAVIACRSVLGLRIKIPRGVPRRYDLPTEDVF
ncbi:hypothetical protein [Nocardioides ultimimeridianus]